MSVFSPEVGGGCAGRAGGCSTAASSRRAAAARSAKVDADAHTGGARAACSAIDGAACSAIDGADAKASDDTAACSAAPPADAEAEGGAAATGERGAAEVSRPRSRTTPQKKFKRPFQHVYLWMQITCTWSIRVHR